MEYFIARQTLINAAIDNFSSKSWLLVGKMRLLLRFRSHYIDDQLEQNCQLREQLIQKDEGIKQPER
jgi:hypothetical protein